MASPFASTSRAMLSGRSGAGAFAAAAWQRPAAAVLCARPRASAISAVPSSGRLLSTSRTNQKAAQNPVTGPSAADTDKATAASLSWSEYLKMRKSRRLAGMVTSLPTTLLAAVGSGSYFLTQDLDPTNLIAGIDPVYVSVAAVLGCTGAGWLVGPSVGSFFWSLAHSSKMPAYRLKDAAFYAHIKRNRVDPSRQSMQNPVGDWHGEKIGSIKQYRQWLRDQAVYRRKASHGLKEDL